MPYQNRLTNSASPRRNLLRPILIEFVGPPGAGKSTIARQVTILLEARGFACACRPPLVTGVIDNIVHRRALMWHRVKHSRLLFEALRFQRSIHPSKLPRLRAPLQLLFLDYYIKIMMSRSYDVVIMDQSFIQTLWSVMIFGAEPHHSPLNRLLAPLYSQYLGSMVFVMIDIDAHIAAERARARSREYSRFDQMGLDQAATLIRMNATNLRKAMARAAILTRAPVQPLSGLQCPEDNAVRLADFVELQLRNSQDAQ
jgi:thymidylate kinase